MTLSPTSSQALPSLSSLIQGMRSQELQAQKQLPVDSFETYPHHLGHHHHLTVSKSQSHPPANYDTTETEGSSGGGGGSGGGVGGNGGGNCPISPRTTRCPSLTNSIYSCSTSSSPSEAYSHPKRGNFSSTRDVLRYTHDTSRISKSSTFPPLPEACRHHSDEKLSKNEKRRRNHLNSEKKRRENIKGGMDALFQLVPACRDQQESKANILKKTKDYILELQSNIIGLQNQYQRMAEENRELQQRVGGGVLAVKSRSRL